MVFRLSENWKDLRKIVIYGFGKTAQGNIDYFIERFEIVTIIDNSPQYRNGRYRSIPIISLADYKGGSEKIVIIAAGKALISIKKQLNEYGLQEFNDYVEMDHFVIEWNLRFKNKLCLSKVTTSVTTKCIFSCKNCNMLMPYYRSRNDFSLEQLCHDIDMFFAVVDEVTSFVVIGGEPFLYGVLADYLRYLAQGYQHRIGNIQVITNGAVHPSKEIINALKECNVEIRMSDYTDTLSYGDRYKEVKTLLLDQNIKVIEFKQTEWIDFGFPQEDIETGSTPEELRAHMLNCHGGCHFLHDGRYYYCSNAWSAQACGLFDLSEGQDYLDLERLSGEVGRKEKLIEFHIGNMKHGYMSFCKRCRGFASSVTVPAAIQSRVNCLI